MYESLTFYRNVQNLTRFISINCLRFAQDYPTYQIPVMLAPPWIGKLPETSALVALPANCPRRAVIGPRNYFSPGSRVLPPTVHNSCHQQFTTVHNSCHSSQKFTTAATNSSQQFTESRPDMKQSAAAGLKTVSTNCNQYCRPLSVEFHLPNVFRTFVNCEIS